MYTPRRMPVEYRRWDIHTSFMQGLPGVTTRHQAYLPLYPLAFSRMDLRGHSLILSNKSAFCHGVLAPEGATHICYCLTPTRYVWNLRDYCQREQLPAIANTLLPPVIALLRQWDYAAFSAPPHRHLD
jgi:hypothetical protein